MSDVQAFRSMFGLPANDPKMVPVPGFPQQGINDDIYEALLDVEYAGASAPNATIYYVYSDDVLIVADYIIDQNLAPVLSYSYGICEQQFSAAGTKAWRSVAQQANAQGITWVAASGDAP